MSLLNLRKETQMRNLQRQGCHLCLCWCRVRGKSQERRLMARSRRSLSATRGVPSKHLRGHLLHLEVGECQAQREMKLCSCCLCWTKTRWGLVGGHSPQQGGEALGDIHFCCVKRHLVKSGKHGSSIGTALAI